MNEIKKIPAGTEKDLSGYAIRPVLAEKRIGWGLQGLIWSGTMSCLPVFTVGGTLAAAMDISSFLAAVLLGTVVIALVGLLTGAIGARIHMTSGFNGPLYPGVTGGKIFSLILAVSLLGWFGYQCHDFAKSVVTSLAAFGFPNGSTNLWSIVGGLLCNYADIPFLNALCLIVPACIVAMLSSVAVLVTYNTAAHSRTIFTT